MATNIDIPPAPPPRPVVRPTAPQTTGDTVTVACKLPGGLLLRMFEKHTYQEPSQTGLRDVEGWKPIPDKTWVVRGTYVASAGQAYVPSNSAVAELLPGGYALTYGVPRDIWDNWLYHNRNTKLVRNKIVWALPSLPAATEEARKDDMRKVRSGLEPLDRDHPAARMPGGFDRRLRIDTQPIDRNE